MQQQKTSATDRDTKRTKKWSQRGGARPEPTQCFLFFVQEAKLKISNLEPEDYAQLFWIDALNRPVEGENPDWVWSWEEANSGNSFKALSLRITSDAQKGQHAFPLSTRCPRSLSRAGSQVPDDGSSTRQFEELKEKVRSKAKALKPVRGFVGDDGTVTSDPEQRPAHAYYTRKRNLKWTSDSTYMGRGTWYVLTMDAARRSEARHVVVGIRILGLIK